MPLFTGQGEGLNGIPESAFRHTFLTWVKPIRVIVQNEGGGGGGAKRKVFQKRERQEKTWPYPISMTRCLTRHGGSSQAWHIQ